LQLYFQLSIRKFEIVIFIFTRQQKNSKIYAHHLGSHLSGPLGISRLGSRIPSTRTHTEKKNKIKTNKTKTKQKTNKKQTNKQTNKKQTDKRKHKQNRQKS